MEEVDQRLDILMKTMGGLKHDPGSDLLRIGMGFYAELPSEVVIADPIAAGMTYISTIEHGVAEWAEAKRKELRPHESRIIKLDI